MGIGELIWGMDAIKNKYTGSGATAPSRFFDTKDRKNWSKVCPRGLSQRMGEPMTKVGITRLPSVSKFSIRHIEILNCTFDPTPL